MKKQVRHFITAVAITCGAVGPLSATAQTQVQAAKPGEDLHTASPRKGWFWYLDPKKEEKKLPAPPAPKPKEVPPAVTTPAQPIIVIPKAKPPTEPVDKEVLCSDKGTWTADCGFIDPGEDFEFQAKQRDILLQMMSLRPDNPDAVEHAQRYMKWVVSKASMAANMWYFNMVQKPDLDPTVKSPISEVGIALATRISQAAQGEYFRLIKDEGGVLFFFTREDCSYCHTQAPYTQRVARTMGLQLINVPLDGKCLEGFEGDNCGNNIKPEQIAPLDVKVVPSLFLFVPSATWIRLGTGVTTDTTIIANTVNFFSAYRAAMLSGLDNSKGARPTVTFDPEIRGQATGVAPANGATRPGEPDRARLMELMGYQGSARAPAPAGSKKP